MEPRPAPLAREASAALVRSAGGLGMRDAVLLTVGPIVGAGLVRVPSVVAANARSAESMLLAWVLGGLVSLAGALYYAELAAPTRARAATITSCARPAASGSPSSTLGHP